MLNSWTDVDTIHTRGKSQSGQRAALSTSKKMRFQRQTLDASPDRA